MSTQSNPIDDAGALKALLINLYTGWGYNAYREENKERADDLLVRNGICGLLNDANTALTQRIAAVHRSIPTPSREDPFPGAEQRALIRDIERVGREVEELEALIRHLPVPENDSTWLRHRNEHDFLPRLVEADGAMAAEAFHLRETAISDAECADIEQVLSRLRQGVERRKRLLTP